MHPIYLDHSATTPVDPEVLAAMQPVFREVHGNASSVHSFGRKARNLLEQSRETIANALGVKHDELFFTSGGTEADNNAILGVMKAAIPKGKKGLAVSAIEHHAILESAEKAEEMGASLELLQVDEYGSVRIPSFQHSNSHGLALVSIMHANNEIGTLQDVVSASRLAKESGAVFHTDAVQSFGKIPFDLQDLPIDLVSITAHKLYGPKGIGALVIRKGTHVEPMIVGGAQEQNRRAGTENVPLAVGFAKAVTIAMERQHEDARRQDELREMLRNKVQDVFPDVLVNGHPTERLPHILSISFPWDVYGLDGEALIMGLDLKGIAVTSGSACTSGTLQPSHVLTAMGRDEKTARATVRFSFGRSNTEDEVEYVAGALKAVVQTARSKW